MKLSILYSILPVPIQNLFVSLFSYKLASQRYGKEFNEIYEFLMESDKWDKDQIIKYKESRIRDILVHAYNHCPYYKNRFDLEGVAPSDFTCLEDLKKFPVLTKNDVREHWREMLADNVSKKDLIPYHTSGSTGKALDFYWTKHNLRYYWAVVWRGRARFNVSRNDVHINFTGKNVVPVSQEKPPYWRYKSAERQYMISMQHITKEKVGDIVNFINKTHAKFFVGYPSIIHSLAILIDELGLEIKCPPHYIFTSAEKTYDFQRIAIEHAFPGVRIIEHYGFSENVACASKSLDGYYHEDFELGHLELNNPSRKPNGETGIMLATGFQNVGMPFIRYEIGDTGLFADVLGDRPSQCIIDIEGRNEDYILTPEGTRITRCDYIFKDASSIEEAQVIQRKRGEIIVRIKMRSGLTNFDDTEIIIKEASKLYISPTIIVKCEFVENIERTRSGKFKAVISEIHGENN